MSTPQLFLPNYAYATSRSDAPSTQGSDYGGVAEAARIYPKRSVTTKIKRESLRKLKAIAALKQETMLAVLERLIDAELTQTLKQEKQKI
jgi:hypothetical protein